MADSSYLLFCGSYTNFDILAHLPLNEKVGRGVYCFHFLNGEIKLLSVVPSTNPAVLSLHPADPKTVYVLEEGIHQNGMISKIEYDYTMDDGEEVTALSVRRHDESHQQTNGKSLCYFKVDPVSLRYGVAINYWEGSADVYRMKENGDIAELDKHLDHMQLANKLDANGTRRQVSDREDHWKHRQVGPHAHSVHYYQQWAFIPDLGENCVLQYGFDPKHNVIMEFESRLKLSGGSKGPRHMVFHPKLKVAYVSNELSSSISVLSIDDSEPEKVKCRLKMIQHLNTDKDMAEIADIWHKNYVAEIGISGDGRFIYCSNRGYDTIAVFKVKQDDGTLSAVSYVPTFGKCPRHFSITPDDQYLIGANQDSNNLVVFKRDIESGTLQLLRSYHDLICAPNFVLFAPLDRTVSQQQPKRENRRHPRKRFSSVALMLFCLVLGVLCKLIFNV